MSMTTTTKDDEEKPSGILQSPAGFGKSAATVVGLAGRSKDDAITDVDSMGPVNDDGEEELHKGDEVKMSQQEGEDNLILFGEQPHRQSCPLVTEMMAKNVCCDCQQPCHEQKEEHDWDVESNVSDAGMSYNDLQFIKVYVLNQTSSWHGGKGHHKEEIVRCHDKCQKQL